MLCQNCGKNEANFKYTQVINGVKKQMVLCSNCAKELGLDDIGFNMPINFSSFLGDMFGDTKTHYMPDLFNTNTLTCNKCNMTYEEFLNTGKFGCENCYDVFESRVNQLLKSIQGGNKHVGRLGNMTENNKETLNNNKKLKEEKANPKDVNTDKIEKLKERLKQEIKEERYEDAAKTRDEIKKLEQ